MKRISTIFLQAIIVLIGIAALAWMLWEPHLEGRNVNSTLYQIYFNDPFLAYAYTVSIAFFVAVYKAFKFAGSIGRNELVSQSSVETLRTIKYCAMILIVGIAIPVAYLFIVRPSDDIAGGVAMGLFLILLSTIVATTATIGQRILQKRLSA